MTMKKQRDLIEWPMLYTKLIFGWPKRWYWPIFLLPTFITMCLSPAAVYFSSEVRADPGKLLQVVREMAGTISIFTRPLGIYLLAEKIYNVYNYVQTEMAAYDKFLSDKAKTAANRRFIIGNRICVAIATLYTLGFFVIVIPTWVSYFTDSVEGRKFPMFVAPEDVLIKQDKGYFFICMTLSLTAFTAFQGTAAFDILFVVSCVLISTMSMNLCAMLNDVGVQIRTLHLGLKSSKAADDDLGITERDKNHGEVRIKLPDLKDLNTGRPTYSDSESDEEMIFASAILCVKYHQKISRLRDDMNAICSINLLINVVFIIIFLGLSLFQALYLGTRAPRTLIGTGLIVIWNFCLLSYIFVGGEQVIAKSEDVATAAYSVYVSGYCSPRLRNALLFIMMRSQRPFCLTAWKFLKINNATLMEVAQKTYSLVACAFKLMK